MRAGGAESGQRSQCPSDSSTPVSIAQACRVWAPNSKAILKHIKSEKKWSRAVAEEGRFGKDCSCG